ncbi:cysteine-rich and transmembrane domain-containing protein 1 [Hyperolius riggenbachi]|uniref:cysteine-rich and transmembrane domain-containing protein 1 n=1 Tax=Hyperolius riggenbachi TaxID=752182 RepID=UPI0035A321FB
MNYENPPPYSGMNPGAPYPPYGQPQGPPPAAYPGYPPGPGGYPPAQPYPAAQPPYQGYPQYGQQPPGPVYVEAPKNTVYVVEERRDNSGESACLTACWTALCCCCLWDMLT